MSGEVVQSASEVVQSASHGFEIASLIANGIVTFIAAGAGAYFAFRFDQAERRQEREDADVRAGNLSLLALAEIWDVSRGYQVGVVDKWRGKDDAWLNLDASVPLDDGGTEFDSSGLAFMLESAPAKVQAGLLEKRRFDLALTMINERSALVRSEVFPKLTSAGVVLNDGRPEADIEKILGVGIVRQLRVLTEGIIQNVDENVKSSLEAFRQLRSALKGIYPSRKFLDLSTTPPAAP